VAPLEDSANNCKTSAKGTSLPLFAIPLEGDFERGSQCWTGFITLSLPSIHLLATCKPLAIPFSHVEVRDSPDFQQPSKYNLKKR
jgi:hypothetical protein